MFAMSGASFRHVPIVGNLLVNLKTRPKGKDCVPTSTNLGLRVAPTGPFTCPDVMVTCGKPQFADAQPDILTNPAVIIEVLSEPTRDYDLGPKFEHYRTIQSLRE